MRRHGKHEIGILDVEHTVAQSEAHAAWETKWCRCAVTIGCSGARRQWRLDAQLRTSVRPYPMQPALSGWSWGHGKLPIGFRRSGQTKQYLIREFVIDEVKRLSWTSLEVLSWHGWHICMFVWGGLLYQQLINTRLSSVAPMRPSVDAS